MYVVRAVSVVILTCWLAIVLPASAQAAFTPSDFPSANADGGWERYVSKNVYDSNTVVGARPARCASDKPFARSTVQRSAYYNRTRRTVNQPFYSASVTLYDFGSRGKASAALRKVKKHVRTCPSYTEWVCNNCDGIWDVWQKLAAISRVGDKTVAWAGRTMGNVGERYRSAAVLDRNYVIKVQIAVGKDAGGSRFPSDRPSKRTLRDFATVAYNALP